MRASADRTSTSPLADPEPGRMLLADRAYEALRDRIVTLGIEPGAPIDEDRLGAELGIGRTPVREAVKRLALERLVTIFPRRGTFASDINITDLAQISDVRAVVEAHAARCAAQRLTDAHRDELRTLAAELDEGRSDAGALMGLDARVHRFVYRSADNSYLASTCSTYLNLSLRIWHLAVDRMPTLSSHIDEHRALLAAIADGDGDRAAEVAGNHVLAFERAIRAVL